MGRMKWDSPDLLQLEVDLKGTPRRTQSRAAKRLAGPVGRRLAREMRVDATGHKGNWFGKPGTEYVTPTPPVSHEMVGPFEVEAGVENKRSGKLFHIIAYGSVNNAPAYDPTAGPRRAMPRIVDELADMAEKAMLGDEE